MAALGIAADVAELAATAATHNDDLVDAWEKRECSAECMTREHAEQDGGD